MDIQIRPKTFLRIMLLMIACLLCAHILGAWFKLYLGHNYIYGLVPMFDFDAEKSVPALYSSFTLMFASILLWLIAAAQRASGKAYFSWIGLAVIFAFLSVDEVVTIHEYISIFTRDMLALDGVLGYSSWIIPYGIGLIFAAVVFFRFLKALPKRIKQLFVASGAIFITGAIGIELISALPAIHISEQGLEYILIITFEELMEMGGVALFIYGLLTYLTMECNSFSIRIEE